MDNDTLLSEYLKKKIGQELLSFQTFISSTVSGGTYLDTLYYYPNDTLIPHWHFITSGFAHFGFELSMRLQRHGEEKPHEWPLRLFTELYAYVSSTGNVFRENDYLQFTDGPLDADVQTDLVGSVLVRDSELTDFDIAGKDIPFFQIFPLFPDELSTLSGLREEPYFDFITHIKEKTNDLFITDLHRTSIL